MTGNEAAAYGALLCQPAVVCAYPITPQSRIPELLSEFHAQGLLKGRFVNVESEMAAIGYVIGASAGGVRTFTATSSQGLAWMHEGLHWAAGARLPIVMAEVNRALGAPYNIFADQTDTLSQRDTGWMQFYCESNQEVLDSIIQAYRVSESIGLPSMVCLDGVYLSYISESTDVPDQEKVDTYLPPYRPGFQIPDPDGRYKLYHDRMPEAGGYDFGYFMGNRYEMHKLEGKCLDAVTAADEEFKRVFRRSYPPVEAYRCEDAPVVLVTAGSTVGTSRYVIDKLRAAGHMVGLVKLKMFRPFPARPVRELLAGRQKIAVVERDLSPGQGGIIAQEIRAAINANSAPKSPPVYGFVAGLGGDDITAALIEKAVLHTLGSDPPEAEVIWLGLADKEKNDQYDRSTPKIR